MVSARNAGTAKTRDSTRDPLPRHRPERRPVRAPEAGRHGAATVFNDDPAAQARTFEEQGFPYLHLVDLNGAFAGSAGQRRRGRGDPRRRHHSRAARRRHPRHGHHRGVARQRHRPRHPRHRRRARPRPRARACVEYPGRIAVGIDAKGGKVAVEGWAETSELTADRAGPAFRGRRRRRHHLHRHRARRHPEGPQPRSDRHAGARHPHPRHRLRRPRRHRRRRGAAAPRVRDARRCHHRPRPL